MNDHPVSGTPDIDREGDDRYRPGETVAGKYRLVRPLGAGGVGRVWVAHNTVLDVHVGLKLIHSDAPGASPVHGERLLQEAQAAAKLRHPAICRVFDFGKTDLDDPFVVMELLHGETLRSVLARESRVPALRAAQTLLPIADALAVAHAQGIVHRDVKPENIFLAVDESDRVQPKLLDFGIARMEATSRKLTLQGVVLGTPDYMSPEQARGEMEVDDRSDVWSCCIVLYELLTGHVPFDEENYNALLWAISHEEPTPTTELAAGDAELWAILSRGLTKKREDRWVSVRALGESLAGWLSHHGVTEDVSGRSLRSWLEPGSNGPASRPAASLRAPPSSAENLPTLPPPPSSDTTGQIGSMAAPLPTRSGRRRTLLGAAAAVALLAVIAAVALSMRAPAEGRTAAGASELAAGEPADSATPAPTMVAEVPTSNPTVDSGAGDSSASGKVGPTIPKPKLGRPLPRASGKKSPAGRKGYDFGF